MVSNGNSEIHSTETQEYATYAKQRQTVSEEKSVLCSTEQTRGRQRQGTWGKRLSLKTWEAIYLLVFLASFFS